MTVPTYELLPGDCRQTMRLCLAPDSVDSIVTDPPYDLTSIVTRFGKPNSAPCQHGTDGAYARAARGFMGMTWDGAGVAFDPDTWREAYRVLKPGGHLLAFGGTRTYHRMVCAIEDAGLEIRDQIQWLYGSGFPKSHNVANGIDKLHGAGNRGHRIAVANRHHPDGTLEPNGEILPAYEARTEAGAPWAGWGTALKPAHEPIVLARKPLVGSVAANVLEYGTGALNIDGCRVETGDEDLSGLKAFGGMPEGAQGDGGFRRPWMNDPGAIVAKQEAAISKMKALGRFPANVIHDGSDEVLAGFPDSSPGSGRRPSGAAAPTFSTVTAGPPGEGFEAYPDAGSGSAARFFYCAKASKTDREEGCEHLPQQVADDHHKIPRSELDDPRRAGTVPRRNHHPTVKPTALMRYLCRLITPPGGTVLDPFAGSGSTGKAALLEGFSFIGCEMTEEYLPIAEARLAHALTIWAERNMT